MRSYSVGFDIAGSHKATRRPPARRSTVGAAMSAPREPAGEPALRNAAPGDAWEIGRLLHDFNSEFDEPSPGPLALAERMRELMADGDTKVLLAGADPQGIAVLRFRKAIWT